LDEIYSARGAIEGLAARRALRYMGRHDFVVLERLIAETSAAAQAGDAAALVEIAVRFHEAICTFARHKRLLHIWRSMIAQTSHFARVAGHFQADLQRDVALHQEVLDALRTGDPDVAESTIKRHVQHAGHQLLRGAMQVGLLMTAGTLR
jgi:DNA-binding GntR family transcriptional regulator